jgi:hypothetical protein
MNHRKLMLAAVLLLAAPTSAYADAIDGDWCSADGQHMTIKGDDITTPDGNQIKGNYTRHAFDYVVPAGEAGAAASCYAADISHCRTKGRPMREAHWCSTGFRP